MILKQTCHIYGKLPQFFCHCGILTATIRLPPFSNTYIPKETCWATVDDYSANMTRWNITCGLMPPRRAMKNEEGVLPVTTPPETSSLLRQLQSAVVIKPKASVYGGMAQQVNIVSRQQWGAAYPKQKETLKGSAQKVVIHHTTLPSCKDQKECIGHLVSIQSVHMKERGFDDIGYNFLVGGDGTVYEGRGWGVVGAHAKGNNHDSLGIAFMGNFQNDTPSSEALSSVKQLLQSGVCQGFLNAKFALFGHRDLGDTECPGGKLYAALPQLRGAK